MVSEQTKISNQKSLSKNFVWTFSGNIIYSVCQWFIIVLLAKMGSGHMVGQYTLGLALTAPIYMLLNLQLRSIQATDPKASFSFSHYLGMRILTSTLAMFIIVGIIGFGDYDTQTSMVILLISISKYIESIGDVIYGQIQKEERMDQISTALILKSILSIFFICISFFIFGSIYGVIIGLISSWLLVLAFYEIPILRKYTHFRPKFSWVDLKSLLKLSFPLGVVMMLISLNTNIPRYFIEKTSGISALGYFSAISYIMVAGSTIVNALGQSSTPKLASYFSLSKYDEFRRLMRKLIFLGVIIGVTGLSIVSLFGKKILTIIYSSDYANYSNVFIIIMLASSFEFISSFLGYGITSARHFKIQPIISLGVVITSIVSCYVFSMNWGLTGIAYAITLTSFVQLLGNVIVMFFIIKSSKRRI
ncbi:hypothetical protein A3844_07765 [Paenibacillus helianthi]|uniref:Polysaccharide biosynthesis protein n=2 Tax=Paenibacillus helianthi TaxID=1349432 RepID=A0ABX3ERB2_9BACL|nr:hypothetical protein A3844_07765 [Paenibacillus helianthi]